jgi:hypothetical protein
MPTVQETNITTTRQPGHNLQVWKYIGTTFLNESTLVSPWLPTTPNWVNVNSQIIGSSGVQITHDGKSYKATFTVNDLNLEEWDFDTPIAIVERHRDGGAWSPWKLTCWGYTTGEVSRRAGRGKFASGQITVDFMLKWSKTEIPSRRVGRANLAQGKTATGYPTILVTPSSEAPLEYVSQADCNGDKITDDNPDTVSIIDVFPAGTVQNLGNTTIPRINGLYAGRTSRAIGSNKAPIAISLYCTDNSTPWGRTWTNIPNMFNEAGGEGMEPIHNIPGRRTTSIGTWTDGLPYFLVRMWNRNTYFADEWIQWILPRSDKTGLPMKIKFEIKAASTESIGKQVDVGLSLADPQSSNRTNHPGIVLTQQWQKFEAEFDDSGNYGGVKFQLKSVRGALNGSDLYFGIRNFDVLYGWNHDEYAVNHSFNYYWLAFDDGNGNERWLRIAFDLEKGGNWKIKPESTVIICDDASIFNARFPNTDKTIYETKQIYPQLYFNPLMNARVKAVLCNNPQNILDYDSLAESANPGEDPVILADEFNFSGMNWNTSNALFRRNPIGTGNFVEEASPTFGPLNVATGAGYWIVDLGEYEPPILAEDMSTSSSTIPVTDIDKYDWTGRVRIGNPATGEVIDFAGKTDNSLIISNRPSPVAHLTGESVYPLRDGNIGTGNDRQIGQLFDLIRLRRLPGKPAITLGRILYSNLPNPGDPGVGTQKWESHIDWELLSPFENSNRLDTIEIVPDRYGAGRIQARWICIVVDMMAQGPNGEDSRVKLNEIIVREYVPGGNSGYYTPAAGGTLSAVVAGILSRDGNFPITTKYFNLIPYQLPIDTLMVTGGKLTQVLDNLFQKGVARYWLDEYNNFYFDADPNSFLFTSKPITWSWTKAHITEEINRSDKAPNTCRQVRVIARDLSSNRPVIAVYPDTPRFYGETIEINDVYVTDREQPRLIAQTVFRAANARMSVPIKTRAAPWLRPYQRHVVNADLVDLLGHNFYVESFSFSISVPERGSMTWSTDINLKELAV